uniref:G_PROTEIN_RECEP_F1_2 domain-containing protein n=1 Tax=Rhabditophanes sp. KR3021 TaxID=114890 RepID=A0AC35U971_9BILA
MDEVYSDGSSSLLEGDRTAGIFLGNTSKEEWQHFMYLRSTPGKSNVDSWALFFVVICNLLGAIGVFSNLFVIVALLLNRKRMLSNIFYVLVLHCSIVDIIRGICLIIYGLPNLLISVGLTMSGRHGLFNTQRYATLILRSCNLLTIFNLLIFTTNEFIVIKFPLHYRRYFSRRIVLFLISLGWLISILFGVVYVILNTIYGTNSLMIQMEVPNSTNPFNLFSPTNYSLNYTLVNFHNNFNIENMKRVENSKLDAVTISSLIIFILCYLCLFIVLVSFMTHLICYGMILRRIKKFHSASAGKDSTNFHSQESKKIMKKAPLKKCTSSVSLGNGRVNSNASLFDKKGSSPASCRMSMKRGNSYKKWKTHIMSRHKYLIVIGTVLFVDILFLLPYSTIQMVSILYITNKLSTSEVLSSTIRWGLQLMIGVHSVCQPMCYFRMNEFRQMACCGKSNLDRAKSFSAAHKNYNYTKSHGADENMARMMKEQNRMLGNEVVILDEIDEQPPQEIIKETTTSTHNSFCTR